MKHELAKCEGPCENPGHCKWCDGGLTSCNVCHGGEASLPKDCPGSVMSERAQDAVGNGQRNFIDDKWIGSMMRKTVTPQDVIDLLNEALALDPKVMAELVGHRVTCTGRLADHETIQVNTWKQHGEPEIDGYAVGILGILNGMFGVDADGWGCISAIVNDDKSIERFELLTHRM